MFSAQGCGGSSNGAGSVNDGGELAGHGSGQDGSSAQGGASRVIVRDLLTSSDEHSRGIKVRLQSGQVGRVKVIYA
jgi:uncharacterized repeat protein (TIGR03833 family)